ncbi:MAG: TIGR00282 family metallophosphoesterase [Candidatus Hydrothermia bacterium]|jgi:metallophosphoesterase (TIGR00282 family)|nr:TIGR00282 family metallophosphoesterase [Candidatus Hydrothermia bacterium]
MKKLKVLAIGDVYGKPGRDILEKFIIDLRKKYNPSVIIVNGENSAHGRGITPKIFEEFISYGIDVITLGNHAFDEEKVLEIIEKPQLLIPYNYPEGTPGRKIFEFEIEGRKVKILTLLGRLFMDERVDDPFRKAIELYNQDPESIYILEFHAEATSEKMALGLFLDGKYSLVFGTHTHIQTADERIFPKGTAYITDIGMTGGHFSVIGADYNVIIEKFLYPHIRRKAEPSFLDLRIQGIYCEIDISNKKAIHIERFSIKNF